MFNLRALLVPHRPRDHHKNIILPCVLNVHPKEINRLPDRLDGALACSTVRLLDSIARLHALPRQLACLPRLAACLFGLLVCLPRLLARLRWPLGTLP